MIQADDGRRLAACCAAAIGVHICIGAAIFLGLGFAATGAPAPPAAEMVVELASLPSAPPVPPSLSPPEPEQKKAEPKRVVDQIRLAPVLKVALNAPPEVAVPIEDRAPERTDNVEHSDKPAAETTKAAAPDAPRKDDVAKAPVAGAPSASPSNAEVTWESRVLAALERKKRYPGEAQRQGQEDVVYVRMTIDLSGRVLDGRVRRSKGYALLDDEAMALVRRASPLPRPPEEVMKGQLSTMLLVPIEFFLDQAKGR